MTFFMLVMSLNVLDRLNRRFVFCSIFCNRWLLYLRTTVTQPPGNLSLGAGYKPRAIQAPMFSGGPLKGHHARLSRRWVSSLQTPDIFQTCSHRRCEHSPESLSENHWSAFEKAAEDAESSRLRQHFGSSRVRIIARRSPEIRRR